MAGRSALNPYATPYVPLSEMLSGISLEEKQKCPKEALDDSEKEKTAEFAVPSTISSFAAHATEKAGNVVEPSSKTTLNSGASNFQTLHDEDLVNYDDAISEHSFVMESLSAMFPNISIESLGDLLLANHGDFVDTIDMLEQFEYGVDFGDLPEISDKTSTVFFKQDEGNTVNPNSQEGSSSGTSDSV